jgi:DNA-binding NarL/FixJ family response regulator
MREASWHAQRPLRILLADADGLYRRRTREMIEATEDIELVAEADDGPEAIGLARQLWPTGLDLVLMDVGVRGMSVGAAIRRVRSLCPTLPVAILSDSTSDDQLLGVVRAGASGFLGKSLASAALVQALRDFHRGGGILMSRAAAARAVAHLQDVAALTAPGPLAASPAWSVLTSREREVLGLVARGAHDREVARQLLVADTTVKTHMQNILRKLGARTRTEAVAQLEPVRAGGAARAHPDGGSPRHDGRRSLRPLAEPRGASPATADSAPHAEPDGSGGTAGAPSWWWTGAEWLAGVDGDPSERPPCR